MITVLHYIRDTHCFEAKGQGVCNLFSLFLKTVQKKQQYVCVLTDRKIDRWGWGDETDAAKMQTADQSGEKAM